MTEVVADQDVHAAGAEHDAHGHTHTRDVVVDTPRISGTSGLPKLGVIVGAVLVGAALLIALLGDGGMRSFYFAYLYGFMVALSLAIGCLFFVGIQHLTRAGWSVVIRRLAELGAQLVKPLAIAFIPIWLTVLFGSSTPYPWVNPAEAIAAGHLADGTEGLIADKGWFLNRTFWLARAALYFGVWIYIANSFLKRSLRQDETGDPQITLGLERSSARYLILLALTATFAAVDWMMTLAPTWYSTIYGVYFFAASTVCFYATASIVSIILWKRGVFKGVTTVEHFHDLGKLLFGFNCFWSYIAFSQYLLIWYANIPEEVEFYTPRYHNGWGVVSVILVAGHFILPFFGLLSRHVKRNPLGLMFWSVWLIAIHLIDIYWLIMPFRDHHAGPFHNFGEAMMTILCLAGFVVLTVGLLRAIATDVPLVPTRDPRLNESLHFHNH